MGKFFTYTAMLILLLAPSAGHASVRDCDSNAMIYCGAYSKDELIRKMTQGDGQHSSKNIRALFDRYNILPRDIRSPATVNGEVHKDGSVWVAGKKVATNAYSYGRSNMKGSTKQGSLYKRPTSVSFDSASLPAYVHMTNGKFEWAIIKSCGNLVTATATAVSAKKVTPTPVVIQPPIVQQTVVQTVVHNKVVAKTPESKVLPQTGLTSGGQGVLALVSISAGIGLWLYSRQKVRERLSRSY